MYRCKFKCVSTGTCFYMQFAALRESCRISMKNCNRMLGLRFRSVKKLALNNNFTDFIIDYIRRSISREREINPEKNALKIQTSRALIFDDLWSFSRVASAIPRKKSSARAAFEKKLTIVHVRAAYGVLFWVTASVKNNKQKQ